MVEASPRLIALIIGMLSVAGLAAYFFLGNSDSSAPLLSEGQFQELVESGQLPQLSHQYYMDKAGNVYSDAEVLEKFPTAESQESVGLVEIPVEEVFNRLAPEVIYDIESTPLPDAQSRAPLDLIPAITSSGVSSIPVLTPLCCDVIRPQGSSPQGGSFFTPVPENKQSFGARFTQTVGSIGSTIKNGASKAFDTVKNVGSAIFSRLLGTGKPQPIVRPAQTTTSSPVSAPEVDKPSSTATSSSGGSSSISRAFSNAGSSISRAFSNAGSSITRSVKGTTASIGKAITSAPSAIKSVVSNVVSRVTKPVSSVVNAVKAAPVKITQTVSKAVDTVKNTVSNFLGNLFKRRMIDFLAVQLGGRY